MNKLSIAPELSLHNLYQIALMIWDQLHSRAILVKALRKIRIKIENTEPIKFRIKWAAKFL
jgi:hypothetical protein